MPKFLQFVFVRRSFSRRLQPAGFCSRIADKVFGSGAVIFSDPQLSSLNFFAFDILSAKP